MDHGPMDLIGFLKDWIGFPKDLIGFLKDLIGPMDPWAHGAQGYAGNTSIGLI